MVFKFIPELILPDQKIQNNILPFLSFPITKYCPFRCIYCGEGGETTASFDTNATFKFVQEHASFGYQYGIRKFRLTGGEPTSHPDFEAMTEFISSFDDAFVLINSNGTKINTRRNWVYKLSKNVKFAVSLDTLKSDLFDHFTRTKGRFNEVSEGIRVLAESGNLYRLNMVVTKLNVNEVFSLITFCQNIGCNLKLLEVCSVPIPYGSWEDLYVPLDDIEDELAKQATMIKSHQYSRGFGIPMPIYQIDNVYVTIKSSRHGAHYDKEGICKDCQYYPCHEGVYDLYLLPDGRLCGCRWSETSVAKGETFLERLSYLANVFQRAEWVNPKSMKAMQPMPQFVLHNLIKSCQRK